MRALIVLAIACALIANAGYRLATMARAEIAERSAYLCAMASDRTDGAIAECYAEHGLAEPDRVQP